MSLRSIAFRELFPPHAVYSTSVPSLTYLTESVPPRKALQPPLPPHTFSRLTREISSSNASETTPRVRTQIFVLVLRTPLTSATRRTPVLVDVNPFPVEIIPMSKGKAAKPGAGGGAAKPKFDELTPQEEAVKTAGLTFCEKTAAQPGWHSLPGGTVFRILRSTALTPTLKSPAENDACMVHYRGTLIDGTKFDSSYDRAEPLQLRPNQVIRGWGEALQYMAEGDKWDVVIPWHQAYGKDPQLGKVRIPGYSTLCFTIELILVKDPPEPKKAKAVEVPHVSRLAEQARADLSAAVEKAYDTLIYVEPPKMDGDDGAAAAA